MKNLFKRFISKDKITASNPTEFKNVLKYGSDLSAQYKDINNQISALFKERRQLEAEAGKILGLPDDWKHYTMVHDYYSDSTCPESPIGYHITLHKTAGNIRSEDRVCVVCGKTRKVWQKH